MNTTTAIIRQGLLNVDNEIREAMIAGDEAAERAARTRRAALEADLDNLLDNGPTAFITEEVLIGGRSI